MKQLLRISTLGVCAISLLFGVAALAQADSKTLSTSSESEDSIHTRIQTFSPAEATEINKDACTSGKVRVSEVGALDAKNAGCDLQQLIVTTDGNASLRVPEANESVMFELLSSNPDSSVEMRVATTSDGDVVVELNNEIFGSQEGVDSYLSIDAPFEPSSEGDLAGGTSTTQICSSYSWLWKGAAWGSNGYPLQSGAVKSSAFIV